MIRFLVTLVFVVIAPVALTGEEPSAEITVSKETTFITEPLAEDGLPDFEKYLLEKGFEGVTPENNASVLLWRAFWPAGISEEYREPMRQALGLDAGIDDEQGLVPVTYRGLCKSTANWLRSQQPLRFGEVEPAELEGIAVRLIDLAQERPWKSEQLLPLALWVMANETRLEWLKEASRRPHLYSPPPNFLDARRESLVNALLPVTQHLREACRSLNAQSMWYLGEGRGEEAWENTIACFRLAGLISDSLILVDQLVAIAVEGITCRQAATVLHHGDFSQERSRQILQQLVDLPPLRPMAYSLGGERLTFIDLTLAVATGRKEIDDQDLFELSKLSHGVDWNYVLREGNKHYDQVVEIAATADRDNRLAAIEKWDEEMTARSERAEGAVPRLLSSFSASHRTTLAIDTILNVMRLGIGDILPAEDRALTLRDMTKVAAALAVYRAEHGEYPESLEQLVPDILPEMPLDLYSGEPFIYRPRDDGGYLLYSVYENGIDNGGTDLGGEIVDGEWVDKRVDVDREKCDLVIRVPVPAFELPVLE